MKISVAVLCSVVALNACSRAQSAPAAGNGPYAAPLASTYSNLTNAAVQIVNKESLKGQRVIIYDQPIFSTLTGYRVAADQLVLALRDLCPKPGPFEPRLVPGLDIGGAASGVASLLNTLTPAYAIQGQSATFDNTAFIAAFAQAEGGAVLLPWYLQPAEPQTMLACSNYSGSRSVADLWAAALTQVDKVATDAASISEDTDIHKAQKKALQGKIDKFQKLADSLTSFDKGPSALSKLLVAESLLREIKGQGPVQVIDLRLDGAGFDTSTRTVLWWKSTKFNSTVMAHYVLMAISYDGARLELKPSKTGNAIVLTRVPKEEKFGSSACPAGLINGGPAMTNTGENCKP